MEEKALGAYLQKTWPKQVVVGIGRGSARGRRTHSHRGSPAEGGGADVGAARDGGGGAPGQGPQTLAIGGRWSSRS